MKLLTLQIISITVSSLLLSCLSVSIMLNNFKFSKILSIVSWTVTILSVLIIPFSIEKHYNKNRKITEDIVATYELLSKENEKFITVSGGRFSHPYICYEDSNGTIKTLRLDENVKIVRNSKESRLEKVKTICGIIKDTAYILYLSD